jgi:hypothetical protein
MHELTYIWAAGGYKESQGAKIFIKGGDFPFFGPISDEADNRDKTWFW